VTPHCDHLQSQYIKPFSSLLKVFYDSLHAPSSTLYSRLAAQLFVYGSGGDFCDCANRSGREGFTFVSHFLVRTQSYRSFISQINGKEKKNESYEKRRQFC
jgi:hypothetical protein